MKPSRQTVRHHQDDMGGGFTSTRVEREEGTIETDDTAMVDLYPDSSAGAPPRRHSVRFLGTHFKVKQLAEARLLQIAEQLSKLADEVRYLNPLVAEAIDEACDATDDALEMIDIEK